MDAKKTLHDIALEIDKFVENILDDEKTLSSDISPIIKNVLENVPVVAFGGKRLRGAFVYYSYLMFGGRNRDEILKISAIIEILHSYLLVHDDIMDKSNIRHRKPTLHKIYQNYIKERNPNYRDSRHFGEGIGICIGDVLSHMSLNELANTKFSDSLKIKVFQKINREFADTGYGQIIDAFGEVLEHVDEEHVMQVHHYKTGKYTYETPLHVGAILAGASSEDLDILTEYAIPGGIAFQIQDDILGMFGDEYRIGKPASSDLKEGKKTLLIIKALEKANPKQKEIIERSLGNPHLKIPDLEEVRKVIVETGSLEYSRTRAIELVRQAKKAIEKNENSKWGKEGKDFLIGVADYMINRDV